MDTLGNVKPRITSRYSPTPQASIPSTRGNLFHPLCVTIPDLTHTLRHLSTTRGLRFGSLRRAQITPALPHSLRIQTEPRAIGEVNSSTSIAEVPELWLECSPGGERGGGAYFPPLILGSEFAPVGWKELRWIWTGVVENEGDHRDMGRVVIAMLDWNSRHQLSSASKILRQEVHTARQQGRCIARALLRASVKISPGSLDRMMYIEVQHPQTKRWITVSQTEQVRWFPTCTAMDSKVYILGGREEDDVLE